MRSRISRGRVRKAALGVVDVCVAELSEKSRFLMLMPIEFKMFEDAMAKARVFEV